MFRDEGGEVQAGALAIAEELRGAVGLDDFVLATREDGDVETDDVERAFLESLVDKDDFFRGEEAIADDFDLAAGFAAFDAGLVENVATNNVDAEFFLNIKELLDNPTIVEGATFEVEEDVFRALGDARFGEVATGDEFVLAGKPSDGVEILVGFGLEILVFELENVLETGDVVDNLGVLVLSDELINMEGVGPILGVVKGVAEIDEVGRMRDDGLIIKMYGPASLAEKVKGGVGMSGVEEFGALVWSLVLGLGCVSRGVGRRGFSGGCDFGSGHGFGGGHGYFSIYF